ncbi:adenine phosphoribosyltransferase [Flavobacteriaceae bacterium]|nr:adenine phosphoribosyltransferase [Flavobacteriaceae bacterium]MDB4289477.1 adenine phosphoribosyltransferase [Flavobacteriaceae bacterium]MDB9954058.1 adenine phosphoribosyltransferase [Flavobacteriaceae bacterium]MDC1266089.1 adenine phosphoribosyltransferase [Flavobacteriaceae bacterium]
MKHSTQDLKSYITDVPDFPKKGIIFKDITSLLESPEGVKLCLESLLSELKNKQIDKVVAIEARGFFFGMLLAQSLNVPFVPVRKPGKLPRKVITQSFDLEYGSDVLELHEDAIQPGDKILIHDDVLATGGTAEAVCKMVESLGGQIVQCNFIMKLDFLEGSKKIEPYPLYAALRY